MTAKIILATDAIEVSCISCLLYGQPGSRKTSLAQTADEPITLAFDKGIYRSFGRKTAVVFETWADVISFDIRPYKTIVVDTVGMCLAKLSEAIIRENPKNGNRLGGLSLHGYGMLKEQFKQWVQSCKDQEQTLVFIAQEKTERNGDDVYYCPDIVGGSYNILMENCDIVGYMSLQGGKRVIDFAPTDRWMAKTPPCGWGQIALPDFGKEPHFLSNLLAEAKASMGRISSASAEISRTIDALQAWLANDPSINDINAKIGDIQKLSNGAKNQARKVIWDHCQKINLKWDDQAKKFAL